MEWPKMDEKTRMERLEIRSGRVDMVLDTDTYNEVDDQFAIAYALSHIPFIIIQRYNRPTLVTLSQRLKEREERIKHAHTDPVR